MSVGSAALSTSTRPTSYRSAAVSSSLWRLRITASDRSEAVLRSLASSSDGILSVCVKLTDESRDADAVVSYHDATVPTTNDRALQHLSSHRYCYGIKRNSFNRVTCRTLAQVVAPRAGPSLKAVLDSILSGRNDRRDTARPRCLRLAVENRFRLHAGTFGRMAERQLAQYASWTWRCVVVGAHSPGRRSAARSGTRDTSCAVIVRGTRQGTGHIRSVAS